MARRGSSQQRNDQRRLSKQRAMRMQSWRKTEPTLLCPVMKQKKSTCYAIALEFHLKLKKKMPLDQHLSIQDFINLIPKGYLNAEDGSLMVDAFHVLSIFEKNGILLEKDCQLTESLVDVVCEDKKNCLRYHAKLVKLHKLNPEGKDNVTTLEYHTFHDNLIKHLKKGVLAVGLTIYPSYSKLKNKEIYYPTKAEWNGKTESYAHVMVCTGHNYDAKKNLFYEFQESAGVKVCDRGYVKIYADLVYQFVEMVV
ncbi:hypothetical protein Rs2_29622 [Raphanus sativus]|uniref:Uncharacterized protein LOC108823008 n=1 Tax=Raphanus sativus TaxID=3726 RepID=A0A6J0KW63_RAPSA|nr:uncharacterized protein LOC108823008 [Raphanus sativus]XP_056844864.1 uncharacterized protein LOC108823008 [Raphanus sativus]KAJ4889874.1 hypothetical protein Rs2_29622 [Raphanus sativus]